MCNWNVYSIATLFYQTTAISHFPPVRLTYKTSTCKEKRVCYTSRRPLQAVGKYLHYVL
jgi:hypothetical protein